MTIAAGEPRVQGRSGAGQSAAVRKLPALETGRGPNEILTVVFLDNQHQVLAFEPLFKGTVDQTSGVSEGGGPACAGAQRFGADPGASAPSGNTEPSAADRAIAGS